MLRLPVYGLCQALRDHRRHVIDFRGCLGEILLCLSHRNRRRLALSLYAAILFVLFGWRVYMRGALLHRLDEDVWCPAIWLLKVAHDACD